MYLCNQPYVPQSNKLDNIVFGLLETVGGATVKSSGTEQSWCTIIRRRIDHKRQSFMSSSRKLEDQGKMGVDQNHTVLCYCSFLSISLSTKF